MAVIVGFPAVHSCLESHILKIWEFSLIRPLANFDRGEMEGVVNYI